MAEKSESSLVASYTGEARSVKCRFCDTVLHHTVVDLGMSPLCESFLSQDEIDQKEIFYPLRVYVCDYCFLVQLKAYVSPESIFTEYAYFSSYSDTWLQHARSYVDMANERFKLRPDSLVVEIASNDGYLLQYFVEEGIPVVGIEPAANVAEVAKSKGIPTLVDFFGENLARQLAADGKQADLIIGNNVLAQVPDLNGFIRGLKILLNPGGKFTIEFPHFKCLVEGNQFDTIYHEHFSYFSFLTVERIFSSHDLEIFDVEELPTHGGSLRIYGQHQEDSNEMVSPRIKDLHAKELAAGLDRLEYYFAFSERVEETKRAILDFLIRIKREGKSIVGYGAPGKGNTLLNYCGIRSDFLDFTVDRNPYKQGKYLPGTHIPIFHPDRIAQVKPDYVLILPWNLKKEIMDQLAYIREWGGKFIVPIPEAQIYC